MNAQLVKFSVTVIFRGLLFLFGGVLTYLGIPKEEQELGLQEAAQSILGLVLMALPVAWAVIQHKLALKALPPLPKSPTPPFGSGGLGLLLLPVLALAMLSQGCAVGPAGPTQEDLLRGAERAMTGFETAVLVGQASGKLSAEDARKLDALANDLHVAYQAFIQAYVSGEGFDAAHKKFNELLREHVRRLEEKGVEVEQQSSTGARHDRSFAAGRSGDQTYPRAARVRPAKAQAVSQRAAADGSRASAFAFG